MLKRPSSYSLSISSFFLDEREFYSPVNPLSCSVEEE